MHHEYKALYFRALRAVIFIMVKSDVDDVKEVLASKPGTSWDKRIAFDFGYITQRVRRQVLPPEVLHSRLKVVYEFFKDKKDSTTGIILFNKRNRKKIANVLDQVKNGYA